MLMTTQASHNIRQHLLPPQPPSIPPLAAPLSSLLSRPVCSADTGYSSALHSIPSESFNNSRGSGGGGGRSTSLNSHHLLSHQAVTASYALDHHQKYQAQQQQQQQQQTSTPSRSPLFPSSVTATSAITSPAIKASSQPIIPSAASPPPPPPLPPPPPAACTPSLDRETSANSPPPPPLESSFKFVYSVPSVITPNALDCVFDCDGDNEKLYIGNIDAALTVEILKKHRIRAVLTTSVETGFRYAEDVVYFHESLPAHDKEGYDITQHFEKGIEFIERNRKYTNVLVHCFAGVSRSASICIAYTMKKNAWSLEKALWHLKKCRPLINPNTGFIKKLCEYQSHLASIGVYSEQQIREIYPQTQTAAAAQQITYSPQQQPHAYLGQLIEQPQHIQYPQQTQGAAVNLTVQQHYASQLQQQNPMKMSTIQPSDHHLQQQLQSFPIAKKSGRQQLSQGDYIAATSQLQQLAATQQYHHQPQQQMVVAPNLRMQESSSQQGGAIQILGRARHQQTEQQQLFNEQNHGGSQMHQSQLRQQSRAAASASNGFYF